MIADMPADRIIVETDCPYLAPVPMRGRRNEPAFLPHVLAKLAEIRGWTPGRGRGAHRGRLLRPVRPDSPAMSGPRWSSPSWAAAPPAACRAPTATGAPATRPSRRTAARAARCMVAPAGRGPPERETTVIVDTSPDFRLQTAAAGVERLDARAAAPTTTPTSATASTTCAPSPSASAARIACYMDAATRATADAPLRLHLRGRGGYPAICDAATIPPHGAAWQVDGPSGADPGGRPSTRTTAACARSATASAPWPIPATWSTCRRRRSRRWQGSRSGSSTPCAIAPHPTHAHLDTALDWIARVKPRRAILTNMHIDLDYRDAGGAPAGGRRAGLRRAAVRASNSTERDDDLMQARFPRVEQRLQHARHRGRDRGRRPGRRGAAAWSATTRDGAGAGLRRANTASPRACIPTARRPGGGRRARWPRRWRGRGVELVILSGYLRKLGPATLAALRRPHPQHPSGAAAEVRRPGHVWPPRPRGGDRRRRSR